YDAEAVSDLATMMDTSSVFSGQFTGFALYDPEAKQMIYAENEHRYFTPASNTKLFTFYTGLKLLPNRVPALKYTVRGDSLIFWGTGDPSFLQTDYGNGNVYTFLKKWSGNLYFSDANFHSRRFGPGWAWDDYQYAYQAEISPFPMYNNLVHFERKGQQKSSLQITPSFFRTYVDTVKKEEATWPVLERDLANNVFHYNPLAGDEQFSLNKPYHYRPELITEMLSDTLGRPVKYWDRPLPDSVNIVYSIPTDTLYKRMLQPSDNFIAEQRLLVTGAQHNLGVESRAIIEHRKKTYLNFLPDELIWVDGSGLSRYNMFTPSAMVHLLVAIDEEFKSDEQLLELLPAGGERGTLENWYRPRGGGAPYVFAKTGTLFGVSTLSGYLITQNSEKLIFSFMNNHFTNSTSTIKKEMEKVLWFIHTHFK